MAPKASKVARRAAWTAAKGEARLVRRAASSRELRGLRFLKYGFFALVGLAVGTAIARSGRNGATPSFTDATGQRDETWGTATPTGTADGGAHQMPEDPNRTGAERDYSDPSSVPLIGEHHGAGAGDIPEQQEEVEQRIRTRVGEDPRTLGMQRLNVGVNDGVAEIRGIAPTEDAKAAIQDIASNTEGVREVRMMMTVGG